MEELDNAKPPRDTRNHLRLLSNQQEQHSSFGKWDMLVVIGLGIDLVDIEEFQEEVDRKKEPFLARVFTDSERNYCATRPNPYHSFAATFAAKEAAMKALGTGWTDEADWQDIEVIREPSGKPTIAFNRGLLERAAKAGLKNSFLSLTHTSKTSAAVVVLES